MKKCFILIAKHKFATFLIGALCSVALVVGVVVIAGIGKNGRKEESVGVTELEWEYWESENAAEYADAARDCRDNGDILLYLETGIDVVKVNDWLQSSDSTGSLYWIGGTYDSEREVFVWENGANFTSELPWAPGEPKQRMMNASIAASTIGREIQLKTVTSSTTLRYICKYL